MKKCFLLSVFFLCIPFIINGQTVLQNFDVELDTTTWSWETGEPGTHLNVSLETQAVLVHSGTGALRVDWQNRCYDMWGGWLNVQHYHPDSLGVYDLSPYTHLSLWYYNVTPQSKPGKVRLRIVLYDGGPNTDWEENEYEMWISDHFIFDALPGWNRVTVCMDTIVADETTGGFYAPHWEGAEGDNILDKDKIRGYHFEFSQDESLYQQEDDSVSGVVIFDDFEAYGSAPISATFFNGAALPSSVTLGTEWSGAVEVTTEDYFSAPASVKWTTGDTWDGAFFTLTKPINLGMRWQIDSLQFKIKADAGLGDLDMTFWDPDEDGAAKNDYGFEAVYSLAEADIGYDGTWKEVKIALKDFGRFGGAWDNDIEGMVDGEMDSTKVKGFKIIGVNDDAGYTGRTVYLDEIWTGNPLFDFVAPDAPDNIQVATNTVYYNLVSWDDVPGETGEVYSVYYSTNPITDVTVAGVTDLDLSVAEGEGGQNSITHKITSPLTDQSVTYYYAIVCSDAAGNKSDIGLSSAATNTAEGIPTISMQPPAGLVCDGDLSEWYHIDPIVVSPLTTTPGHVADPMSPIDDENDLYVEAYFAVDDNYFYAAFDVTDDVFSFDTTAVVYKNDGIDLYIGLYDWRGLRHANFESGDEPDYEIGFHGSNHSRHGLRLSNPDEGQILNTDSTYFYFDESATGYIVETRIPWSVIADLSGDPAFQPVEGMRIALDMTIHDSDAKGVREGILGFGDNNDDNAYTSPKYWTHTWIGAKSTTGIGDGGENVPYQFNLSQNYPNPFNPITNITYLLAKTGHVQLSIFNLLGQRVRVLVDKMQTAGTYTVQWNGRDTHGIHVASGIYIYQLENGDATLRRKLMLLK